MSLLRTVKITFGYTTPSTWNHMTAEFDKAADSPLELVEDDGVTTTSWECNVTADMAINSANTSIDTTETVHFPYDVIRQSYKVFDPDVGTIEITGLNDSNLYDLWMAYTMTSSDENDTEYTIDATSKVLSNPSAGIDEVEYLNVAPTSGVITIDINAYATTSALAGRIAGLYIEENGDITYPDPPSLSISLESTKPRLDWTTVSGAVYYQIERTLGDGVTGTSWAVLDTTTQIYYVDGTTLNSTEYAYRAKTYDGSLLSDTYSNVVTITSGAPAISSTKDITILQQRPIPDFYLDEYRLYLNDTAVLRDASEGMDNGIDSWSWTITSPNPLDTPQTSTLEDNVNVSCDLLGSYTVTLETTNSLGIPYSITKDNFIQVVPAPIFPKTTFVNYPVIRADDTLKLVSTATGGPTSGNATGWSWSIEHGIIDNNLAHTAYVTFTAAGKYWIEHRSNNNSGGSTIRKEHAITVLPVPTGTTYAINFDTDEADFAYTDFRGNEYMKIDPTNAFFANPIVAGDEITLSGTFPTGKGLLCDSLVGTETDKITIKALDQMNVFFAGKNMTGIRTNECQHLILDGLTNWYTVAQETAISTYGFTTEIDGSDVEVAESTGIGLKIDYRCTDIDATGIHIDGNEYGFAAVMGKTSPNSGDSNSWMSSGFIQANTNIYHNKIEWSEGEGFYLGHFDSAETSYNEYSIPLDNGLIYGNLVYNCGWDGFQLSSHRGIWEIHDNYFYNSGRKRTTNQKSGYSMNPPHEDENGELHIYNNKWVKTGGSGITGAGMANTYIHNNTIVGITGNIEAIYYMVKGHNTMKNVYITNNTLQSNRNQLYFNANFGSSNVILENLYIANNVIVCPTNRVTDGDEDVFLKNGRPYKVFVEDPDDNILSKTYVNSTNATFDPTAIGNYHFYDFHRGLTEISPYSVLALAGEELTVYDPFYDANGMLLPAGISVNFTYPRGAYAVENSNTSDQDHEKEKDLLIYTEFPDRYGNVWDIKVYEENNEDTPYRATLAKGGAQFRMPEVDITDPIKSVGLDLTIVAESNFQFLKDPYNLAKFDRTFPVKVFKNDELYYHGYIIPELYQEEWLHPPYLFNLNVSDGLKYLERVTFKSSEIDENIIEAFSTGHVAYVVGSKKLTRVSYLIRYILSKTKLELDYLTHVNTRHIVSTPEDGFVGDSITGQGDPPYPEPSFTIYTKHKASWESADEAFIDYSYGNDISMISIDEDGTGDYGYNIELGDTLYNWQQDGEGNWYNLEIRDQGYHYIPNQSIVFHYTVDVGVDEILSRHSGTQTYDTESIIFMETFIDAKKFDDKNCKESLEMILQPFGCQITQINGYWVIQQIEMYQSTDPYKEFRYDWAYIGTKARPSVIDFSVGSIATEIRGGQFKIDTPIKSQTVNLNKDFKEEILQNGDLSLWTVGSSSTPLNWTFTEYVTYPTRWSDQGVHFPQQTEQFIINGQEVNEDAYPLYDAYVPKIENDNDDVYLDKTTKITFSADYAVWDKNSSTTEITTRILWDLYLYDLDNTSSRLYWKEEGDTTGWTSSQWTNTKTIEKAFYEVNEFGNVKYDDLSFDLTAPTSGVFLRRPVGIYVRLWQANTVYKDGNRTQNFPPKWNFYNQTYETIFDNISVDVEINNQEDKQEFKLPKIETVNTLYYKDGTKIELEVGDVTSSNSLSKIYLNSGTDSEPALIGTSIWYRENKTTILDNLQHTLIYQIINAKGEPIKKIDYSFESNILTFDALMKASNYLKDEDDNDMVFYTAGCRYTIEASRWEMNLVHVPNKSLLE